MLGPGAKLGRYELRDPIGSGGMSAVYKGYDPVLDREIAIKVLPANLAREKIFRQRFHEEARALGRVDHPNLIRIYAVGQEGPTSYYAMELVRGLSLREVVVARGRLPLKEAMAAIGQFLKGLEAIHNAGIVHRDIKPGNIMVGESGRVILMDFGLARRVERQAMTAAGAVLGTPEYMSPEQAKGETADHRSDLYSAGIVLFEMLAGAPPFGGRDTLTILRKHVEAPVPAVRRLVSQVPAGVEKVLGKLLAKTPEKRYANVASLMAALGPLLPDGREAELTTRGMLHSAEQAQGQRTRSFVKEHSRVPSASGAASGSGPAAAGEQGSGGGSGAAGERSEAVASGHQPPLRVSWVPWAAMATALLAVAVALLALLRPTSVGPSAAVWRQVVLRDGRSFVGRHERWTPLNTGDAEVRFKTRKGDAMTVAASEIRSSARWQGLAPVSVGALAVAFVALGVSVAVLVQSRRRSRGATEQDGVR